MRRQRHEQKFSTNARDIIMNNLEIYAVRYVYSYPIYSYIYKYLHPVELSLQYAGLENGNFADIADDPSLYPNQNHVGNKLPFNTVWEINFPSRSYDTKLYIYIYHVTVSFAYERSFDGWPRKENLASYTAEDSFL